MSIFIPPGRRNINFCLQKVLFSNVFIDQQKYEYTETGTDTFMNGKVHTNQTVAYSNPLVKSTN
jgi:hypothetical protein